jgi:MFS family permease
MSQEIAVDKTQAGDLENAAARKNAILLSICQALSGSASPLSVALGGIVGSYLLAGDKTLATLPVTGFTLGVALMSVPAALLMRRIGRRRGFMSGALMGMLGMALAVTAISAQMFWLFVVALLAIGAANSFTQQYRFAAADRGTAEFKAKAISWVLAGGVAASLIGPQMILFFSDFLAPIPFAGAFLWGTGLFSLSILAMLFLEPGHPPRSAEEIANKKSRPLSELAAQPKFLVAVFCATGS